MSEILKKRRHLRCPACAKISRAERYIEGARWLHDLGAVVQSSLSEPGRRGGFKWTPDAMTREEVAALAVVVDSVSDRLEMLLDALKRSDDDPAEVAAELAGEIETADNKADRAREQLAKDFLKVFNAEEKRKQRRR